MFKKKQVLMIVSIAVISFLIGTVFNFTTMATSSSGNPWDKVWAAISELQSQIDSIEERIDQPGIIRFEEPTETEVPVYPDTVVVAQFDWYPQNSSNNALLVMRTYWQYSKKIVDYVEINVGIKLYDDDGNVWGGWEWGDECYQEWKWEPSKWIDRMSSPYPIDDHGFPLNQARYRFVVEAYAYSNTAYVRNINIIIMVADGLPPSNP